MISKKLEKQIKKLIESLRKMLSKRNSYLEEVTLAPVTSLASDYSETSHLDQTIELQITRDRMVHMQLPREREYAEEHQAEVLSRVQALERDAHRYSSEQAKASEFLTGRLQILESKLYQLGHKVDIPESTEQDSKNQEISVIKVTRVLSEFEKDLNELETEMENINQAIVSALETQQVLETLFDEQHDSIDKAKTAADRTRTVMSRIAEISVTI